jgi:hypothetical protein
MSIITGSYGPDVEYNEEDTGTSVKRVGLHVSCAIDDVDDDGDGAIGSILIDTGDGGGGGGLDAAIGIATTGTLVDERALVTVDVEGDDDDGIGVGDVEVERFVRRVEVRGDLFVAIDGLFGGDFDFDRWRLLLFSVRVSPLATAAAAAAAAIAFVAAAAAKAAAPRNRVVWVGTPRPWSQQRSSRCKPISIN